MITGRWLNRSQSLNSIDKNVISYEIPIYCYVVDSWLHGRIFIYIHDANLMGVLLDEARCIKDSSEQVTSWRKIWTAIRIGILERECSSFESVSLIRPKIRSSHISWSATKSWFISNLYFPFSWIRHQNSWKPTFPTINHQKDTLHPHTLSCSVPRLSTPAPPYSSFQFVHYLVLIPCCSPSKRPVH